MTNNVKKFQIVTKKIWTKLFISTGGFKNLTPTQAVKLIKNNIFNIELSEENTKNIEKRF